MTLSTYQSVVDPLDDVWGKLVTIENKSDNPLFVTLFEEGVPLDNRIRTENRGIEMTRSFFDDIGPLVDVSAREQGIAVLGRLQSAVRLDARRSRSSLCRAFSRRGGRS